ncbi:hypothetical protein [Vibrio sp. Hal054]|uniref:hypothetical protein n=1 Tax=Vibrio sp. Hal054 TaxID=3035158 RepID=UPI00301C5E2A
MFIQVSVWGSKRLGQFLMERNHPSLWMSEMSEEDKRDIKSLHPVALKKDFQTQHGSIMPKLLEYYDVPNGNTLAIDARRDLAPYIKRMKQNLEPYLDESIGARSRFRDSDDVQVYPYLSVVSQDYIVSHNIYSDYAGEDFLRLLNRQLQNLNPDDCFRTEIRAYDPDFDTCYQRISVKSPNALIDKVCAEPLEIAQAWLGQHQYGYALYELENELGEAEVQNLISLDTNAIISPIEMNRLIASGKVEKDIIRNIQLEHNIKWSEAFDDAHVSTMYDLLGIRVGQNFTITPSKDVQYLDFDWDSLV